MCKKMNNQFKFMMHFQNLITYTYLWAALKPSKRLSIHNNGQAQIFALGKPKLYET